MCNQVHGERAILLVLLYLDIRIRASILSNIVGCDLFNFGKKFLLAILRHLLVANSKAKLLLIRLLGLQLDHTIVIFNAILQLHGRWRCLLYLLVLFLFVFVSKLVSHPTKWPLYLSAKTFWR